MMERTYPCYQPTLSPHVLNGDFLALLQRRIVIKPNAQSIERKKHCYKCGAVKDDQSHLGMCPKCIGKMPNKRGLNTRDSNLSKYRCPKCDKPNPEKNRKICQPCRKRSEYML